MSGLKLANSEIVLKPSLLEPRRVWRVIEADDGGFLLDLACGHLVWMEQRPVLGQTCCGHCLNALVVEIRKIQRRQRME